VTPARSCAAHLTGPKRELSTGSDTLDRKLRYLLWLN
jgi:hypothetical protein